MRYGPIQHFQSGVCIPLSSLRSAASCGGGEFQDLLPLARWCRDVGLDLIQILPINDTGHDPSPYAGLSAWALHPIYLRLPDVEGAACHQPTIDAFAAKTATYHEVLSFKLDVLHDIFLANQDALQPDLQSFCESHPWVVPYAAFRAHKEAADDRPWWEWDGPVTVDDAWQRHADRMWFYIFVQREAVAQMDKVARDLDEMGIKLKGDLPILLAEDSVDVWSRPELFRRDVAAGAPPDMFATRGQNWSFPAYHWENPQTLAWWQERIRHADRWFHAIRIDHVLGFFRLWQIPRTYVAGMLGSFHPTQTVAPETLHRLGFSSQQVQEFLVPGGRLDREIPSERVLMEEADLPARHRALEEFWDRILVPNHHGFALRWEFETTSQFAALPADHQARLLQLDQVVRERRELLWEEAGRGRLQPLVEATDMLVCAEDLGTDAACVPAVLADLGILRLWVDRWTNHETEPEGSFPEMSEYPHLSVASPSTHDSSTLRGWWQEASTPREAYVEALGETSPPPDLDPTWMQRVLERQFQSNSILCIVGFWELLELSPSLRPSEPGAGRINVPGTPSDQNWQYRMPLALEELGSHSDLGEAVQALTQSRRARPLPVTGK